MTHDEMIAVIQAHKKGKTVQFRAPNEVSENAWLDIADPTFRFHDTVYRIKPEPREFWITFNHSTPSVCAQKPLGVPSTHVREVID